MKKTDMMGKMNKKLFRSAVLIPTYNPSENTYKLAEKLTSWYPARLIVVIDDATPLTNDSLKVIKKLRELSAGMENMIYLRTSRNSMKAGALNFGMAYLKKSGFNPGILFTLDDDVFLNKETLPLMEGSLLSDDRLGAVCSFVRVENKNKNLLTRLQGLEYHSFNITKIADNTFFKGPMVMQGMLSGFRMKALEEAGGFSTGHLIEDYEVTARLKTKKWRVKMEKSAIAGTNVPETVEELWKQRVRWNFGGMGVVAQYWRNITSVLQDMIGHLLFLGLIALLIASSFIKIEGDHESLMPLLISLTLVQIFMATIFNLIVLTSYKNADYKDWLLKLSVFPEFVYCNLLSLILLGSYTFFAFKALIRLGLSLFEKIGFSSNWGTREILEKGGLA